VTQRLGDQAHRHDLPSLRAHDPVQLQVPRDSNDPSKSLRPQELDQIIVEYAPNGSRQVHCFCGQVVNASIVPHLKNDHPETWSLWVSVFITLRELGWSLKQVMRLFAAANGTLLFSWTVVERAVRREVETGRAQYRPPQKKRITMWEPENFSLETTTIWDFPSRGTWNVHVGDYRGNWPPQVPRNLISRYTKPGDLVIDAFTGGGTTLIEALLLGRRSIGLDISNLAIQTTMARIAELNAQAEAQGRDVAPEHIQPKVVCASALVLASVLKQHGIDLGTISLICAHPPYLNSLEYTQAHPDDLATVDDPATFYSRISDFSLQAYSALAPGGICAVLIGDVRRHGQIEPLGFNTLQAFLDHGFTLENLVIKTQHRDRSSEFYKGKENGALLMAHEYLLILRKDLDPGTQGSPSNLRAQ
jgi:DNA modification methylase